MEVIQVAQSFHSELGKAAETLSAVSSQSSVSSFGYKLNHCTHPDLPFSCIERGPPTPSTTTPISPTLPLGAAISLFSPHHQIFQSHLSLRTLEWGPLKHSVYNTINSTIAKKGHDAIFQCSLITGVMLSHNAFLSVLQA